MPGTCHAAGEELTLARVAACTELLRLRHRGGVSVHGARDDRGLRAGLLEVGV